MLASQLTRGLRRLCRHGRQTSLAPCALPSARGSSYASLSAHRSTAHRRQPAAVADAASEASSEQGSSIYDNPQLYDDAFSYRDFAAECAFLQQLYQHHAEQPVQQLLELGWAALEAPHQPIPATLAPCVATCLTAPLPQGRCIRSAEGRRAGTQLQLQQPHLPGPPPAAGCCRCGPGRHAAELARQGVSVTALDINPAMLAYAQAQAQGAKGLAFVQGDPLPGLALTRYQPGAGVASAVGCAGPGSRRAC
jgi:hypothetical protein